jgi:predicted metalloprotease with PDZ domain
MADSFLYNRDDMRIHAMVLAWLACAPLHGQGPVRLQVDATDAPRRLFHVRMNIPAKPGPMTLLYPEWIPGEHGPTGPVVNLVGLKIAAGGQPVPWRRDDVNMYAFHVEVPAGASALDVAFDFISPPDAAGFSSGSSATSRLAVIGWNQFALYPEGAQPDDLQYQASLRLPDSWRFGTALPARPRSGAEIEFETVSLTTLIDSPLSAGAWYRTVDLGTDRGAPHFLDIAGDSARSIEMGPELIAGYKRLVAETGALFGVRHYRDYHFLLTLSDHVAHFGLEHHESSDDRVPERTLIDAGPRTMAATLLPHEFVHSWNGKYRRPAGLVSGEHDGGYDFPMKGGLLWVYEGLTEYLGEILAPRSGLETPQEFLDSLAMTAATLDTEYGRTWRPLADTAVDAQVLYDAGDDYRDYRRSVDFYAEGTLIWLEADVQIRQLSKGAKSLDDFCRAFFGGSGGAPAMKPYSFDDVVAGLNAVQPYDWAGFFRQRLDSTAAHAPLGGIDGGGWKLTYTAIPSGMWSAAAEEHKLTDLSYSLGFKVKDDGTIVDVTMGGPAQKAGIAPAAQLIAVDNRQFTPTVLHEAVQATAAGTGTLEFLMKTGEYYEVRRIEYMGGERFPSLVRNPAVPDLLSEIGAPLAKNK